MTESETSRIVRNVELVEVSRNVWECTPIDGAPVFYLVDGAEQPACIKCGVTFADPYYTIPMCSDCAKNFVDEVFIMHSGKGYFNTELIQTARRPPQDLYVVQRPDGMVKIGISQDLTKRIENLECSGGHKLKLLLMVKKGGAKLEQVLHTRFADKRTVGEWFQLSATDIQNLRDEFNTIGSV